MIIQVVYLLEGFMRGFYNISEWIMRFAYVNILWIFFSLLGLIMFGFFPATTAMFAVIRKWVLKQPEIPVFQTFWFTYKSEFLKSNLLGLFIIIFGYILYFNINIIEATMIPTLKLLYIPNLIVISFFLLTLIYIFPVFVHFDVSLVQVLKNAFILMVTNLMATCSMGILSGFLWFIFLKFPGLIPFFSGSFIAFLLMWLSNAVFVKVSNIQN
jgi:uncharacterized membrane protein YesL